MMDASLLRAITLDLDDTLWPVGPTLVAAEHVLSDWLREHAPATAAANTRRGLASAPQCSCCR